MKFKAITRMLLAAAISASMLFAAGCGNSAATSSQESDTESAEEDESYEDIDDEDLMDEDDVDSPYGEEFDEYLEANTSDALLANHDRAQFVDTTWTLTGNEESSSTTYLSADLKAFVYDDGYTEFVRNGSTYDDSTYDGYDPESDMAFRVIFEDEEYFDEELEKFNETISTLYGEGVETMDEEGDSVVFTSYVRSAEAIMFSFDDGETEISDGDLITRVTTFDKETRELVSMEVTFTASGSDPVTIEKLELTTDGDAYSPDGDLLAKLDSDDSHTATITLNPGEENETVLTATVGKGCVFYTVIDSGYVYYTDEACTEEADENIFDEENEDIVLYGKYDEEAWDDDAFLEDDESTDVDEDDDEAWDLEEDEEDSDESTGSVEEVFG